MVVVLRQHSGLMKITSGVGRHDVEDGVVSIVDNVLGRRGDVAGVAAAGGTLGLSSFSWI